MKLSWKYLVDSIRFYGYSATGGVLRTLRHQWRNRRQRRMIFSQVCVEALESKTLLSAVLVEDINKGGTPLTTSPVAIDDTLYFVNSDETGGCELWKIDGTESGTICVSNCFSNPNSYDYTSFGEAFGFTAITASTKLLYSGEWFDVGGPSPPHVRL